MTDVQQLISEVNAGHDKAEAAELRADGAMHEAEAWRWYTAERVYQLCQQLPSQDAVAVALGRDVNFQSQVSVYARAWEKFGSRIEDERPAWRDVPYLVLEKLGKREEARRIVTLLSAEGGSFTPSRGEGAAELAEAAKIPTHSNPRWRARAGWDGINYLRSEEGQREFGATVKFQETKTGDEPFVLLVGDESEAEVTLLGVAKRTSDLVVPLQHARLQLKTISGQPSSGALARFKETCASLATAYDEFVEEAARFGSTGEVGA